MLTKERCRDTNYGGGWNNEWFWGQVDRSRWHPCRKMWIDQSRDHHSRGWHGRGNQTPARPACSIGWCAGNVYWRWRMSIHDENVRQQKVPLFLLEMELRRGCVTPCSMGEVCR